MWVPIAAPHFKDIQKAKRTSPFAKLSFILFLDDPASFYTLPRKKCEKNSHLKNLSSEEVCPTLLTYEKSPKVYSHMPCNILLIILFCVNFYLHILSRLL